MRHPVRSAVTAAALALASLAIVIPPAGPATAAGTGSPRLSGATTVGVHNTYSKGDYTYLAQALDAWDDVLADRWRVSHSDPLGNDNNCVVASSPAGLYTGDRNQNLGSCLSDIKWWLAAHPAAGPVFVKIEMKAGFDNSAGMGPAELDSYIAANAGTSYIYR